MSTMRPYLEDSLGLTNLNEAGLINTFNKMKDALKGVGEDPFRNVTSVVKNPQTLALLTEAIKFDADDIAATTSQYKAEDMQRLNTMYENVAQSMLNEAIQSVGDLSPIMMNSFGIQERALISAHLPRAVKQVVAKIDNFKLTERIPYIVDIRGIKHKFLDAFVPDANGSSASLDLETKVKYTFDVPSSCINLYDNTTEAEAAVSKDEVFGYDSTLTAITYASATPATLYKAASATAWTNVDPRTYNDGDMKRVGIANTYEFGPESLRSPNVENGTFIVSVITTPTYNEYVYDGSASDWGTPVEVAGDPTCATIQGQFDLSNGNLVSISTTDANITKAIFEMVLSPETHKRALSVSYDMKHTPVNIPVGEHFEYSLSEEFKDASDKYYNVDAMAMLSDYMGKAVEQVKDIKTLHKYQDLVGVNGEKAVVTATFDCTPTTGFAQGKEEYIRREFHPFIEKICIMLKNKVRIPQCHFRVLGNPLDIRLGAAAGAEYIYKRNEQFAGEIAIDYEFSVTSDVHKIFYISSERVPQGAIYVFLIPNTIENNISTVNHYEYATYVSNRYKGTNSNLPTVMISTRYLTKEYYPVIAYINIVNNITDANIDNQHVTNGEGLTKASIYGKVKYVNA